ncbi:hypothetical protein H0H92_013486 [Tricholoma furcatifolium]|nr:hypothetical protein H0H92_013486 [Tricholoma furcatifolium]
MASSLSIPNFDVVLEPLDALVIKGVPTDLQHAARSALKIGLSLPVGLETFAVLCDNSCVSHQLVKMNKNMFKSLADDASAVVYILSTSRIHQHQRDTHNLCK